MTLKIDGYRGKPTYMNSACAIMNKLISQGAYTHTEAITWRGSMSKLMSKHKKTKRK